MKEILRIILLVAVMAFILAITPFLMETVNSMAVSYSLRIILIILVVYILLEVMKLISNIFKCRR